MTAKPLSQKVSDYLANPHTIKEVIARFPTEDPNKVEKILELLIIAREVKAVSYTKGVKYYQRVR